MANPYAPVGPQDADATREFAAPPSTWIRNFKALGVVTVGHLLLNVPFAFTHMATPEVLLPALLTFASVASAWANVPLGKRVGWDRGGLPVVLVLFFVAVAAYSSTALLAAGMLYVSAGRISIYTP